MLDRPVQDQIEKSVYGRADPQEKANPRTEVTGTNSAAGRAYLTLEEADTNTAGWGAAGNMEPQLGWHELLQVFSFLEVRDLLRAAQVNKVSKVLRGVAPLPLSADPGWGKWCGSWSGGGVGCGTRASLPGIDFAILSLP